MHSYWSWTEIIKNGRGQSVEEYSARGALGTLIHIAVLLVYSSMQIS